MCLPFVIVMYESLNRPQCEKMDMKSYIPCWKGFKSAKDAAKPENVQDLEDFYDKSWQLNYSGQTIGLMKHYHKTNMNHLSFF